VEEAQKVEEIRGGDSEFLEEADRQKIEELRG
jgi:hypothetical protein